MRVGTKPFFSVHQAYIIIHVTIKVYKIRVAALWAKKCQVKISRFLNLVYLRKYVACVYPSAKAKQINKTQYLLLLKLVLPRVRYREVQMVKLKVSIMFRHTRKMDHFSPETFVKRKHLSKGCDYLTFRVLLRLENGNSCSSQLLLGLSTKRL